MEFRIGQSRDIHRLEKNGRKLVIGGVLFPFEKGPVSHSDGDVLYHAVGEALLGALALGDLGTYFPDSNPEFSDMDSSKIVAECFRMVSEQGYRVVNLDACAICEKPRLKGSLEKISENIATLLQTEKSRISVKAQTNEGCGEVGRGEAIEATVSVLLMKD